MILTKVIIDNIRSHKHYEFEPALSGTTAISGTNGAGKSTIINAFAWSLFGSKAQSLRGRDYIREGVDPKEEYVGVQSFFTLGNRDYKVIRRIISQTGTATCKVYSKEINSDDEYILDCGPGVVHSERFIRGLLGFDEKGFYSSSFVQQKQVDLIVSAGPKERGAIIEQMIGVSAISSAIKIAKDNSKALQKSLSVIQVDSIDEVQASYNNQLQKARSLKALKEQTQLLLEEEKAKATQFAKVYEDETIRQNKKNQLLQDLALKENDLSHAQERLQSQLEFYQTLPKVANYTENSYNEIKLATDKVKDTYINKEKELALLVAKEITLADLFSHNINPLIIEEYQDVQQKSKKAKETLENLKQQHYLLKDREERLRAYLEALDSGLAECPYCKTPITNIEEEKIVHEKELKDVEQSLKEIISQGKKIKEEDRQLLNEIVNLQGHLDTLAEQKDKAKAYREIKLEIDVNKISLATIKAELQTLESQLSTLSNMKSQSETIISTQATIKMLNKRIVDLEEEMTTIKSDIQSLGAKDSKTYATLTQSNQQYMQNINELEMKLLTQTKDLEICISEGKLIKQQLNDCLKAYEEYTQIAKQLEITNSSIQSLSEFKDLRIRTSIPSLSQIATEILTKFTEGTFRELRLNEKFEASVVTSSGNERAVSLLSGGELSAVAIALRLAIALFLHEGTQSLLILDEVLVSMSEDRQQQILETISSLSSAQIILIAHSQVANSFADKIVLL